MKYAILETNQASALLSLYALSPLIYPINTYDFRCRKTILREILGQILFQFSLGFFVSLNVILHFLYCLVQREFHERRRRRTIVFRVTLNVIFFRESCIESDIQCNSSFSSLLLNLVYHCFYVIPSLALLRFALLLGKPSQLIQDIIIYKRGTQASVFLSSFLSLETHFFVFSLFIFLTQSSF